VLLILKHDKIWGDDLHYRLIPISGGEGTDSYPVLPVIYAHVNSLRHLWCCKPYGPLQEIIMSL